MAFCANYVKNLTHYDLERYKEKIKACGVDPYEISEADCSEDPNLWPDSTDIDRMDYFVFKTNFTSKQSMKALKTLEAHNFFTSGLVFHPRSKKVSPDLVLLLGKVKHSQSMSAQPLKSWLLVKDDGEIVTGHCTCMAGRGEACSHLAAIVFMVEYAGKVKEDLVGTNVLNAWLPPTMSSTVPKKRVSEMDIISPAGRLAKLARTDPNDSENHEACTAKYINKCTPASTQAIKGFSATIAEEKPKAIVLSTLGDYRDPFIPQAISDDLPKLMSELNDEEASKLEYSELLVRCRAVIQNVCATAEQVKKVEELTRSQSKSDLWFKFRTGRITASNMKLVCQGNISKPARSTINTICYGSQKFYSADVERSKELEKAARQKYTFVQKKEHTDFSVEECGLFLQSDKAYIAASPDGIVSCTCCEGTGSLEIKCPREENLNSCFDEDGQLLKNHQYFYQVQTQMYVCDLNYCDFFAYNPKKHILSRVLPNKSCHKEIIEKSQMYFMFVILPELIAKHFSVNRPPLAPSNSNSGPSTIICFCQQPRRDPVVICGGQNCTFTEFHCRCVDLAAPKKNWFCAQCKKQ